MQDYDEIEVSTGMGALGVTLAFLGGALAGAAAALLLAPKTGLETREQIKTFANSTKDKVARAPRAIKEASLGAKEKLVGAYRGAKDEIGTTH